MCRFCLSCCSRNTSSKAARCCGCLLRGVIADTRKHVHLVGCPPINMPRFPDGFARPERIFLAAETHRLRGYRAVPDVVARPLPFARAIRSRFWEYVGPPIRALIRVGLAAGCVPGSGGDPPIRDLVLTRQGCFGCCRGQLGGLLCGIPESQKLRCLRHRQLTTRHPRMGAAERCEVTAGELGERKAVARFRAL